MRGLITLRGLLTSILRRGVLQPLLAGVKADHGVSIQSNWAAAMPDVTQSFCVAVSPVTMIGYAIDASRVGTDLGWRSRENFETGIKETVR
jgi:hypothetical protein